MSFIFKDTCQHRLAGVKCVILCAGEGSRISSATHGLPKSLISYTDKPVLDSIINYWSEFSQEIVFVVGYRKDMIIDFVSGKNIKAEFIEQDKPKGIADAVYRVKDAVGDNFIVVLGDCVCSGVFQFPPEFDQGVGICVTDRAEDIKKSYSVELDNHNFIKKVVEKPREITNKLCGMGYYFFNSRVFEFILKTPPSALRGEIEITDVIQNMIDSGLKISPIYFKGEYININYPQDLKRAQ